MDNTAEIVKFPKRIKRNRRKFFHKKITRLVKTAKKNINPWEVATITVSVLIADFIYELIKFLL